MGLGTRESRVKKICEDLQEETIKPAIEKRERILSDSYTEAERIIDQAKKEAKELLQKAQEQISEEKNIAAASIKIASKKTIDTLKKDIETMFCDELFQIVNRSVSSSESVAQVINGIVKAIEVEGVYSDMFAVISKEMDARLVAEALVKDVITKLRSNPIELGDITGGAQVVIVDEHLTIDMSSQALTQLLLRYVRDDLRMVIFDE